MSIKQLEVPSYVKVSLAIAIAKQFLNSNKGNVIVQEINEGALAVTRTENDFTISLDYDSSHEEQIGELGISCTWESFEEAEEVFWDLYKSHWEEQTIKDTKLFKYVITPIKQTTLESTLEDKPTFRRELRNVLVEFNQKHNEYASLQDFVTHLLNSNSTEIDFENLNPEALLKVTDASIVFLNEQLSQKGRGR